MKQITLYTTTSCSFCTKLKRFLESRQLEYREIDLSKDLEGRIELMQRTGMMTFPQVLVDQELVGGFKETLAASESGRLDQLMAGSVTPVSAEPAGSVTPVSAEPAA